MSKSNTLIVILITALLCYPDVTFTSQKTNFPRESLPDIGGLLERSLELYKANQLEQALLLFKQILSMDPSCAMASLYVGHVLKKLGKVDESTIYFEKALDLDVHLIDAYIEACHFYSEQFEYEKVEKLLLKGLSHNPSNTHLLFQLATLYNTLNKDEESLALFMEIKKRLPHNPSVLYNLAFTLKKLGRIQEAISLYNYALELNPNNVEIIFGRALAYLSAGLFEQGWIDYESRWQRGQLGQERHFEQPLWDGSSLSGKTLFLHAEQGLGDTFQFVRYAKIAKERGATVIVAAQTPLVTLLSLCPYIDKVIALKDTPWPVTDFHAPLASMPYLCKTRVNTVPTDIPYLYADESLVEYWKEYLAHDSNIKVGIVWNGNSNYSTAQLRAIVAQKSVNLSQFKPLADCSGVTLYSLQKETGMDQLQKEYDFPLHLFPDDFDVVHGRFMDTVAIIKNLDLVIAVDTGTAHLAAALGARVWLLLPHPSDWRWMHDRLDTPWYPNMRLFRQPRAGDWDAVFVQVKDALKQFVAEQMALKNKSDNMVYEVRNSKEKQTDFLSTQKMEHAQNCTVEKKSKTIYQCESLKKEKEEVISELMRVKEKIGHCAYQDNLEKFDMFARRWVQLFSAYKELERNITSLLDKGE